MTPRVKYVGLGVHPVSLPRSDHSATTQSAELVLAPTNDLLLRRAAELPALFPAPIFAAMIRNVENFRDLLATPFSAGINAVCWPRPLVGDFAEVVERLGPGDGIVSLDETRLRALPLSSAGQDAVAAMLEDLRLLRSHGFAPELNCIYGYPRDEDDESFPTDVYSFHADRAPIASETWLCTYHGAPSEGLPNDEAQRRVDIPSVRAELLRRFGGNDDADFAAYLEETCQDLHYVPLPHAQPFSFGVGNLWRIAVDHPGNPVSPCIHRAPPTRPDDARLLLIS